MEESLRTVRLIRILFALLVIVPLHAFAWETACGKEGQKPCSFSPAKFEAKQNGLCRQGQFHDLIDGGTCWSCPEGYGRTLLHAVNTDRACEKMASTDYRRVQEHGKGTGWFGTDCPSGQFWDIVDGNCHSCPGGWSMNVLEHVHSDRKCGKSIPADYRRATPGGKVCGENGSWDPRNGGECWTCPKGFVRTVFPVDGAWACEFDKIGGGTGLRGCEQGLSSIRNVCLRTGVCGKDGQRPCEVTERMPSCDESLREDFKINKCVALRPGETPFTAGVSSLAGYWGSTVYGHCKELLGGINIPGQGDLGVGLRCGRDITAGFVCGMLRDLAAGPTDMINTGLEKLPEGASLAQQMNAAYNRPPCTELGERFAKATQHGAATGAFVKMECPPGQFWDPNGNCYSCPKDFTRTGFPVTDERACSDRIGGNLHRFGCGAIQGVLATFNEPLKCTIEKLEDGSIYEKPIDFDNANQAVCMATGELGYSIIKTGIDTGKALVTADALAIIEIIGKVAGTVMKGPEVKRLLDCRRQLK
jgi:hypothetical protein